MQKIKLLQLTCNVFIVSVLISMWSCDSLSTKPTNTSPFYDQENAKLWKHRVNCLADADSMAILFPGIEVDIYYVDSTSTFICTHGEVCSGESLQALLSSIKIEHRPYVWLDFKNSNDSQVVAKSIPILWEKLLKLQMLDRTIVETKNTKCLDSLNKYGLYSSYWVPHYYDTNPSYSNEEMMSTIATTLKEQKPTVLSADYHMFDFLKNNFPDAFLHLWVNGLISEEDKVTINELRAYTNTKVVLIDFDQPF